MKKFIYFQPEYVGKFKCDGTKCNARCCRDWRIDIDKATYKKYSRIKPKEKAKEILSHMTFDSEREVYVIRLEQSKEDSLWQKNSSTFNPNMSTSSSAPGGGCLISCCKNWTITIDAAIYKKYRQIKPKSAAKEILSQLKLDSQHGEYVVKLDEKLLCPFLTEESLCRLQRDYGEEFLSVTCSTYPRRTHAFGKFFERSLTLTCPAAAEMILFAQEPMKFEFVEVPEKFHGKHGRISITKFPVKNEVDAELLREIQITMIHVLQARKFSLNQRLIVLGLFLDKLQELILNKSDTETLLQLIAAYRSEEFLAEEISPLLEGFVFDAKNFVTFMLKFIGHTLTQLNDKSGRKFLAAFEEVLGIKPDENNQVLISEIASNFEKLADSRKNFSEKYSAFMENYLVNELFYSMYPWRFKGESITKNFIVFLISFKIFELILFAAEQKNLNSKDDLLTLVNWFMMKTDHNDELYKRFFELLAGVDDTYLLMATLL